MVDRTVSSGDGTRYQFRSACEEAGIMEEGEELGVLLGGNRLAKANALGRGFAEIRLDGLMYSTWSTIKY
jgi:hypothetical protein